jgi:hypothetical protein
VSHAGVLCSTNNLQQSGIDELVEVEQWIVPQRIARSTAGHELSKVEEEAVDFFASGSPWNVAC